MKQLWFDGRHYYVASELAELDQLLRTDTGEGVLEHEWETVPVGFPVTLIDPDTNTRETKTAGEWARGEPPGRLGGVDY